MDAVDAVDAVLRIECCGVMEVAASANVVGAICVPASTPKPVVTVWVEILLLNGVATLRQSRPGAVPNLDPEKTPSLAVTRGTLSEEALSVWVPILATLPALFAANLL